MNFIRKSCSIAQLLLIVCTALVSCKKDDDSSEKRRKEKKILQFNIDTVKGVIDEEAHTITVTFPYNYKYEEVVAKPTIVTSDLASVSPASGEPIALNYINFTYRVTAADGSVQEYKVHVENDSPTFMESFSVPGYDATIDQQTKTIKLTGSFTYLRNNKVTPVIKVSDGATSSPASGETVDLFNVQYSVAGAWGGRRYYYIHITDTDNFFPFATAPLVNPDVLRLPDNPDRPFLMFSRDETDKYIAADVQGINSKYLALLYITENEDVSKFTFKSISYPPSAQIDLNFMPKDLTKDLIVSVKPPVGETALTTFRTVKTKLLTAASGHPSVPASFLSADDTHLYALYTGEIDKVSFVEQGGSVYTASVISNTTAAQGVHDIYIKANTTLPVGNYHLKVLFKDGATATPSYVYKK